MAARPRPTARRCAASARSCATWRTTRSTASPARRRSSTPGSRSAIRISGSGSARRSSAGSSCRSAAAGSSPTATCRPASRSCASSSTASAGSSASSGAATASSGAPTRSATPGQLPQILREAGITRFLTQKLSWNRFNRPEHHTFDLAGRRRQRGARALPARRHLQQRRDRAGAAQGRARLPGSRPRAHEPARLRARRRRRRPDQGHARDAAPRGRPAGPAAHDAADERGVLRRARGRRRRSARRDAASCTSSTTAASTPRRRAPSAATGGASKPCTTPSSSSCLRGEYPREELDRLWKLLLLQQFHDILPGLVDPARLRGRRARPRRRRGRCRRARGRRARRSANTIGFARREVVGDSLYAAAPFGAARVVEPGRRGAGRRADARERAPARDALAGRRRRVGAAQGERPRGAGGAGQRLRALRRPPGRVRRLGHRPVGARDPARVRARDVLARELDAAARRDHVRAAVAHAGRAARRRVRGASSSTRRSTGRRSTRC